MKKIILKIIALSISAIVLVLFLLLVVWLFEMLNINVPGSREMWIGLIGAILGGFYTMLGVIITIAKQEHFERESQRILNMPLISVKVKYYKGNDIDHHDFSYCNTCKSSDLEKNFKKYPVLFIKSANGKTIFNIQIVSCMIEGHKYAIDFFPWGSELNNRLLKNESLRFSFTMSDKYFKEENDIISPLGMIRVYYEDILKNAYYQDVPCYMYNTDTIQKIELIPMKQPELIDGKEKSIKFNFESYRDDLPFE